MRSRRCGLSVLALDGRAAIAKEFLDQVLTGWNVLADLTADFIQGLCSGGDVEGSFLVHFDQDGRTFGEFELAADGGGNQDAARFFEPSCVSGHAFSLARIRSYQRSGKELSAISTQRSAIWMQSLGGIELNRDRDLLQRVQGCITNVLLLSETLAVQNRSKE